MIIQKITYHIFISILFFTVVAAADAQTVEIKTDRNQILIGERIQYDLYISLPANGYTINFDIPDSLPHFEAIEKGKFDTSSANGSIELSRKFIFTSFDSGSWYIPALPVTLQINNDSKKIMTDSVLINVGFSPADSTGMLRDIKPVMEVKVRNYLWVYITGAVLTLLLIIFMLYSYFNKRKRKPLPVLYSTLSPYEEAMKDLEALSTSDLNVPLEIKVYHTQLNLIFKRYYSRIVENNLLNKTTGELLLHMKQRAPEAGLLTPVAGALRMGDAVKFAKFIPVATESGSCFTELKKAIASIEKNKRNSNQQ